MGDWPVIPIRDDPRLRAWTGGRTGPVRPVWLADDPGWEDHLAAMSLEDCEWLAAQYALFGTGGRLW